MMYRRSLKRMLVLVAVLGTSVLSAHDEKNKGPATAGEIVSMAEDRFDMKTAKGNVTVTFNKETKFEQGEKTVDKGQFKKGDKVTVYGTKLPTGELVAKEVMLGTQTSPKGMDHSKMDMTKKK